MQRIARAFLFLFIFGVAAVTAHAATNTAQELQDAISARNDSIASLQKEISGYQSQLDTLGKSADTLSNAIKELDINKKKLELEISLTQKKIDAATAQIKTLSGQIGEKDKTLNYNRAALAQSIRELRELDATNITTSLLSDESITGVWNSISQIGSVQASLKTHADTVRQVKAGLVSDKTDQEKAKATLIQLQNTLGDQKKIVDANTQAKNKLLKDTKNQQSNYQALVAQKQALIKSFETEIQDYESKLKYVLDPKRFPSRGSSVFAWPLDSIVITQMFGKTVDAVRLYASGSHSGVDLRAAVGTPVYAMAQGTVMGEGDTDVMCPGASFGKWVLVKYDNGLAAAFGHLSLIKVQKGDSVDERTVIGYSGQTGRATGPHLHVSVYVGDAVEATAKPSLSCKGKILTQPIAATNAYLNLLDYTPPTTSNMFK